jgi:MurNAc alpha-1-phosphate uridylyltransferase
LTRWAQSRQQALAFAQRCVRNAIPLASTGKGSGGGFVAAMRDHPGNAGNDQRRAAVLRHAAIEESAMTIGAMILAAGRGERMRPLSDALPKPLLQVGGKPLIVRQVEALAQAGFASIVINASHLAPMLVAALGDGRAFGASIRWSIEPEALETAGGIATATPLLPPGPALIVSGDVWSDYDYARLIPVARAIAAGSSRRVHLVMVDNPPYHARGDFVLGAPGPDGSSCLSLPSGRDGEATTTYANIGVYDTALFRELPRGVKLKLLPLFRQWIGAGIVGGERHAGRWANVGTPADLAELDRQLRSPAPQSGHVR